MCVCVCVLLIVRLGIMICLPLAMVCVSLRELIMLGPLSVVLRFGHFLRVNGSRLTMKFDVLFTVVPYVRILVNHSWLERMQYVLCVV